MSELSVEKKQKDHCLKISDLSVKYYMESGEIPSVDGVSLSLLRGEVLALVGESGCGKSTLCRSVIRVLSCNAKIISGKIELNGLDVTAVSERELLDIRGKEAAMILQEPMSALDPTMTIVRQLTEAIRIHDKTINKREAQKKAVSLLTSVGIKDPEYRYKCYPGQLSGGMCQRCVIAMALSASPKLLIADEPTTALDVTTQAEILKLLMELRDVCNMSILIVTHDLGVAAKVADRIAVMKDGKIIETGTCYDIFNNSKNEYTKELLASMPYSHLTETVR